MHPRPGWVENDPEEIRDHAMAALQEARERAAGAEIVAVGITNQRETIVVWDRKTGRPIYPAINWQDARTAERCTALATGPEGEMIRRKTGLPAFPYFSATKLAWIFDHVPGARERAARGELAAGTMDSWLIWWLTGGPEGGRHLTDFTNASRTMLFDIGKLEWDDDLLELFGVPRACLPTVVASSSATAYGTMRYDKSARGVPITAAIGDQQAAAVGQACFGRGEVKNTYGTANAILMNVGPAPVHSTRGLISTLAYVLEGPAPFYALEGPTGTTGAAIHWLQTGLGIVADLEEVEPLALSVEDTGGVYFVPAFSGLYAPYWDPSARGTIVGLTAYSTRAHVARATLEAICYQTKDVIDAMEQEIGLPVAALRADGGATSNRALMQIQADVLGKPVMVSRHRETTALGAAYMAGISAGLWKDLGEIQARWAPGDTFVPSWEPDRRQHAYAGWKAAVAAARYRPEGARGGGLRVLQRADGQ